MFFYYFEKKFNFANRICGLLSVRLWEWREVFDGSYPSCCFFPVLSSARARKSNESLNIRNTAHTTSNVHIKPDSSSDCCM